LHVIRITTNQKFRSLCTVITTFFARKNKQSSESMCRFRFGAMYTSQHEYTVWFLEQNIFSKKYVVLLKLGH